MNHTGLFGVALLLLFTSATAQQPPVRTECAAYSNVPLPAEAANVQAPRTAPSCASYRWYAGLGRPQNYAKACSCAWQERLAQQANLGQNLSETSAWMVGGSLILADIYANGAGVPRNVPLARRLACEFDANTASLALNSFSDDLAKGKHIEVCEYGDSTIIMNFCFSYQQEISDSRANRFYRRLRTTMSARQKLLFDLLLQRQRTYVDKHGNEVDQGGTIRAIRTMGSQSILNDLFRTHVVHLERQQWPKLTPAQVHSSDARLKVEYRHTIQALNPANTNDAFEGGVTRDGVTSTQRAWEKYLAAWVTFAAVRYPDHADAIRADVIADRIRLLKTIR